MSQQSTPPAPPDQTPRGDPWHAFSYIVSGVAIYGVLGWLADLWLGTRFLVAVGILVGAGLGLFLTYNRFNRVRAGRSRPSAGEPNGPTP